MRTAAHPDQSVRLDVDDAHVALDRTLAAILEGHFGCNLAARRTIVERLSRGPASVSELAKPLDMTLSAVVQHLQILEDIGMMRMLPGM